MGEGPLSRKEFFRLKDRLYAAVEAAFIARWGSRRARLNKALLRLVEVLLGHGQFAAGVRVAYSTALLARTLHVDERTITRAVAKLEHWPELVTVLRLERGDVAWDGRRTFREHIEWELGPALRSLGRDLLERHFPLDTPGTVSLNPRHDASVTPVTLPPDPVLDPSTDLKLKHDVPPPPTDRPNLEEHSINPPSPTLRATDNPSLPPTKPTRPMPEVIKARSPALPCSIARGLAVAVIRQHRELAEHKSPYVPIAAEEISLVHAALEQLVGCRDDREKLELCARVSELAARDSAEQGHRRASLRFTFGGLPEEPQKFFLARVARLREERVQLDKERQSAELTSALLGLRPPTKARSSDGVRLRIPATRDQPVPKSRNSTLSPAELFSNIEAFKTRMNQPHVARAG